MQTCYNRTLIKHVSPSDLIPIQLFKTILENAVLVKQGVPKVLLMKKIIVLIAAGFLISINLAASQPCSCEDVEKSKSSHDELISYLDKTDLEYV